METLAEVLETLIEAANCGPDCISTRTSGAVSASTIRNWLKGTAKTARDWRALVKVAAVLCDTDIFATNRLLRAGAIPPIEELYLNAQSDADKRLLSRWIGNFRPQSELFEASDRFSTLTEYLAAIRAYSNQLPYINLYETSFPPLSSIYVEVQIRKQLSPKKETQSDSGPLWLTIEQALGQHTHIMIMGEPGLGKSCLLRYLAMKLAGDEFSTLVPVFVSAQSLANGKGTWSERMFTQVTSQLGMLLPAPLPRSFFSTKPGNNLSWIILIDALDEILNEDARAEFLSALKLQADRSIGLYRFVFTTRPALSSLAANWENLGIYALGRFGQEQIRAFVQHWFVLRPKASSLDAESFLRQISESNNSELAEIPLLLTLAALIYEQKPGQPFSWRRSSLYENFITLMLTKAFEQITGSDTRERWHKRYGIQGAQIADILLDHRRDLLEFLAIYLQMYQTEKPEPSFVDVALNTLVQYVFENKFSPKTTDKQWLQAELKNLLYRTGLIVIDNQSITYTHHTFREYLAACALTGQAPVIRQLLQFPRRHTAKSIIGHWQEERWREIVRFVIILLDENGQSVDRYIQRIIRKAVVREIVERSTIVAMLVAAVPTFSYGTERNFPENRIFTILNFVIVLVLVCVGLLIFPVAFLGSLIFSSIKNPIGADALQFVCTLFLDGMHVDTSVYNLAIDKILNFAKNDYVHSDTPRFNPMLVLRKLGRADLLVSLVADLKHKQGDTRIAAILELRKLGQFGELFSLLNDSNLPLNSRIYLALSLSNSPYAKQAFDVMTTLVMDPVLKNGICTDLHERIALEMRMSAAGSILTLEHDTTLESKVCLFIRFIDHDLFWNFKTETTYLLKEISWGTLTDIDFRLACAYTLSYFDKAEASLEALDALATDDNLRLDIRIKALRVLIAVCAHSGNTDKARIYYENALHLVHAIVLSDLKLDVEEWNNQGCDLSRKNHFEEAICSHSLALSLRPDIYLTHLFLAEALLQFILQADVQDQSKVVDTAIEHYVTLLQHETINVHLFIAKVSLGILFWFSGHIDEAKAHFKEGLARLPNSGSIEYSDVIARLGLNIQEIEALALTGLDRITEAIERIKSIVREDIYYYYPNIRWRVFMEGQHTPEELDRLRDEMQRNRWSLYRFERIRPPKGRRYI